MLLAIVQLLKLAKINLLGKARQRKMVPCLLRSDRGLGGLADLQGLLEGEVFNPLSVLFLNWAFGFDITFSRRLQKSLLAN